MKISLEAAKEHLKNREEVLCSLFCTIETGYKVWNFNNCN